jgi:spermidine/putrescine transport system permease protein
MKQLKIQISLIVIIALMYLPITTMLIHSFNAAPRGAHWQGATWQWFRAIFADQALLTSMQHSALLAFSVAVCNVILAPCIACARKLYRLPGRHLSHQSYLIAMAFPDIVLGISFLIVFHFAEWPLGFPALFMGHLALTLPVSVLLNTHQFKNIPAQLWHAAQDLGASDGQGFMWVMIPLLKPSIIAAALISWVFSFDDAIISFFLSSATFQTLPVYILGLIKSGVTPMLNAVSSLILCLTAALSVLAYRIMSKRYE